MPRGGDPVQLWLPAATQERAQGESQQRSSQTPHEGLGLGKPLVTRSDYVYLACCSFLVSKEALGEERAS